MKLATFTASMLLSFAAMGADDSFKVEGLLGQLHVSQGGQDFRVALENAPTLCGNAWTTAYLDATDANYDTYVQALLTAKAAKLPVTLVTRKNAEGYCKLFFLTIK